MKSSYIFKSRDARQNPNAKTTVPPPSKARKRHVPSTRPKRVRAAPSQIPGAGMGLYLLESVKAGERIARYSGKVLTLAEHASSAHSQYRLQIHKNLFLDAQDACHFEGRYINDARNSRFKTNARFAANYTTNTCPKTGFKWVSIFATKPIQAGEEIFLNYGRDFRTNLKNCEHTYKHTAPSNHHEKVQATASHKSGSVTTRITMHTQSDTPHTSQPYSNIYI